MEAPIEDEISLEDVVRRIWARRGLVLAMLLVAVLGAVAAASFWLGRGPYAEVLYYIDLNGIEKGHYPGGSSFSPNDLRSREVLRAAVASLDLEEDAGLIDRVAASLLIEHGSPATLGIVQKYRGRLTATALSLAEIDAINAEFSDELALASGGSLRLMLNLSVAGLDAEVATRLVQEIPAHWSRIYTQRYRIYQDPGLERFAVSLDVGPLDQPSAIIASRAALRTIRAGLAVMAGDNRVNHRVSASGLSASELLDRASQFENIRFRPLSEAVMTRRDPVADSYRYELRRRIQLLQAKRTGFDQIAEQVAGHQAQDAPPGDRAEGASSVNQLHLSGDALRRIIGLAEQASSAAFLREVMLKRHGVISEIAELEAELAHLDTPSTFEPPPGFASLVEAELADMLSEYADLYAVMRAALRSDLGSLYSASTAPFSVARAEYRRALFWILGAAFLSLCLGVLTALVIPDTDRKRLVRA